MLGVGLDLMHLTVPTMFVMFVLLELLLLASVLTIKEV
jgi:hypothetical protein